MRKFTFGLIVLALSIGACSLNQPNTIVITATFSPNLQPSAQPSTQPGSEPPGAPSANPTHLPVTRSAAASLDYAVVVGDTLSGIAAANDVSVDTLLTLNTIADPNNLIVGQIIHLPAPPNAEGSAFRILPDSRHPRAPGSSQSDVQAFVNQQPGFLRSATDTIEDVVYTGAQIVERVGLEYSVDPRLLLAMIEYRSKLLSNPTPTDDQQSHPLNAPPYANGVDRKGLYLQLAWAADQLNYGYYGWTLRGLNNVEFTDNTRVLFARSLNAGSVGVQYFLSLNSDYATWQQAVSASGFYQTYVSYFGDPFAGALDPVVPNDLQQPTLTFPFPSGQTWYFTGGWHGGWGDGGAWAAVDFAPPDDITTKTSACYVSDFYATAVAPGVIARTAEGTVILDLDGDGDESTGWTILYLHMAAQDRVQTGTVVKVGDKIGHPSCEGGVSTGTHVHVARRYNGEWIPVQCDDSCAPGIQRPPLVMSGWTFYGLAGQLYQGGMLKRSDRRVADQGRNNTDNQVSW